MNRLAGKIFKLNFNSKACFAMGSYYILYLTKQHVRSISNWIPQSKNVVEIYILYSYFIALVVGGNTSPYKIYYTVFILEVLSPSLHTLPIMEAVDEMFSLYAKYHFCSIGTNIKNIFYYTTILSRLLLIN